MALNTWPQFSSKPSTDARSKEDSIKVEADRINNRAHFKRIAHEMGRFYSVPLPAPSLRALANLRLRSGILGSFGGLQTALGTARFRDCSGSKVSWPRKRTSAPSLRADHARVSLGLFAGNRQSSLRSGPRYYAVCAPIRYDFR